MATILITGMAGGLSQTVARKLLTAGHAVIGVDYRPVKRPLEGVTVYQANYNKTRIEDVFKRHPIDVVLHLGRVGNLREDMGKRFDLNVVGSQKIMNLCRDRGVSRLLVFSTFHIYGAHPANHTPIYEDEPIRAGTEFPQIADAIQLDNMACTWVYQHPDIGIVVLRPTNVVGPHIHNTISSLLRAPTFFQLAGFNPMFQFIHENDLANAIVTFATGPKKVSGVFNIAGEGAVPLCTAFKMARVRVYPLPAGLVTATLRYWAGFPRYFINFFKYPCIISDKAFRETFDWAPEMSLEACIWDTVAETREKQEGVYARRHPAAAS